MAGPVTAIRHRTIWPQCWDANVNRPTRAAPHADTRTNLCTNARARTVAD